MKLISVLLVLASVSFANPSSKAVLSFYQPSFELIDLAPMCPPSRPDGVSCMAIGSIATVRAYAGCLGQKAFFDAQVKSKAGITTIYINALAKTNKDMEARVRCIKPQEIIEKIILPSHMYGEVEIINQNIDTL